MRLAREPAERDGGCFAPGTYVYIYTCQASAKRSHFVERMRRTSVWNDARERATRALISASCRSTSNSSSSNAYTYIYTQAFREFPFSRAPGSFLSFFRRQLSSLLPESVNVSIRVCMCLKRVCVWMCVCMCSQFDFSSLWCVLNSLQPQNMVSATANRSFW